MNEADTCRKFIVPRLQAAGWDNEPHSIAEQTNDHGRSDRSGRSGLRPQTTEARRLSPSYTRDFPLAVVEAKPTYKIAGDGLQQAKQYAEMLGLSFAYASNGQEILEFEFVTGLEKLRADFPTPDELWDRYRAGRGLGQDAAAQRLLTPSNYAVGKGERYYQQIAINRVIEAIVKAEHEYSSRWRPAPERPLLPSRSAGSFGRLAGIEQASIAARAFCISPTETS